jgi:hypothetical protein
LHKYIDPHLFAPRASALQCALATRSSCSASAENGANAEVVVGVIIVLSNGCMRIPSTYQEWLR